MNDYEITCVNKSATGLRSHGHITRGGTDSGEFFTVAEVYEGIKLGHAFHMWSPEARSRAVVLPWHCPCGVNTLRSRTNGVWDDNLDSLKSCL